MTAFVASYTYIMSALTSCPQGDVHTTTHDDSRWPAMSFTWHTAQTRQMLRVAFSAGLYHHHRRVISVTDWCRPTQTFAFLFYVCELLRLNDKRPARCLLYATYLKPYHISSRGFESLGKNIGGLLAFQQLNSYEGRSWPRIKRDDAWLRQVSLHC